MSEPSTGIRRPLSNAGIYMLAQRALGARAVRSHVVDRHLRPRAGDRLLDLGCGPADILELLPEVDYVGVDASPAYVEAARRRFNDRGEFVVANVADLEPLGKPVDAALAIGIVHHLEDDVAARLFDVAARSLNPDGRMVTIDPAIARGQPRLAAWLIERDRGGRVRSPSAYRALAAASFDEVELIVHHDLARLPYTHAILVCRCPRRASSPLR